MGKELEIGKRYTWEEVCMAYPAKWVRMNDCTIGWGDSIVDGIFTAVHDDGDTDDEWLDIWNGRNGRARNDRFRRTEVGIGVGIIDCLNAQMEVRDEP